MLPIRFLITATVASSSIAFLSGRVVHHYWSAGSTDRLEECGGNLVSLTTGDDVCNVSENTRGGVGEEGGQQPTEDDSKEILPVGEHLVVDFQGVERAFLMSQELLLEAMVELATYLDSVNIGNYSCHNSSPRGHNVCGGTSRGGHDYMWIHARPDDGVLFVDVFSAGMENEMLSFVPTIGRLFGRPEEKDGLETSKSSMRWLHKMRGFHDMLDEAGTFSIADLQWYPVGMMVDYKKEVASVQTKFQHISVWDVLWPARGSLEAFDQSLSKDYSYPSSHPEFFAPDRIVFLDGLLQSRKIGDAAYHEALVHPALFAHPNPQRVAIIGGGEGATLREVLKHNTIQEVVMIEIDAMMVNASRTYLPEWSDCSNIEGRANNCFDDLRTNLHYDDAFQWFKDRFVENHSRETNELFDVIIMDALDPQGLQDIVAALYTDSDFYQALYNGLAPDGILIAQVGQAPQSFDPYYALSVNRHFNEFIKGLKKLGFSAITEYEEAGCGFYSPWAFIVASRDKETITESWFANEAVVELKIKQRINPTVNGGSPLLYFDGAMMASYRYPTKAMEEVYCRNPLPPVSCKPETRGFHLTVLGFEESTTDLGRLIHYIHLEGSTERVLSKSLELCVHGRCMNEVLSTYKDELGGMYKIKNGQRIATHHLSTTKPNKPSCANVTATSLDYILIDYPTLGSDIDDIVRLRQPFLSPKASPDNI